MIRRPLPVAVVLLLVATLAMPLGCGRSSEGASDQLRVTGSTTVLPIAEMAAELYGEEHPEKRVLVSGVGSSEGIENVANGWSDIGTSSRDLKDEEKSFGLVDTPIAHDAIAVIVHPDNPVKALTMKQVADIFSGKIDNWKQVGGRDEPIGLVNRDEASGTREAFKKIVLGDLSFDPAAAVLPGTGQVRSVVGGSPGAIGYISLGFVDDSVRPLKIDGVAPNEKTVANKEYPIARLLHFFTKGEPAGFAKEYTDFVLSDRIQEEVVRDAGFLPIKAGEK
jgi:phosphate transport system substrate-binding protein